MVRDAGPGDERLDDLEEEELDKEDDLDEDEDYDDPDDLFDDDEEE